MNEYSGKGVRPHDVKVAVVIAGSAEPATIRLQADATVALYQEGVGEDEINFYHVPDVFAIPFTVKQVAAASRYDGVMTLGAVIGNDRANSIIYQDAFTSTMQVALKDTIPVIWGILLADSRQQVDLQADNAGAQTAQRLLAMVSLIRQIG